MTDEICALMVAERPWYIREHRCPNRARYLVAKPSEPSIHPKRVCGVHRRSLIAAGWVEVPPSIPEEKT